MPQHIRNRTPEPRHRANAGSEGEAGFICAAKPALTARAEMTMSARSAAYLSAAMSPSEIADA